jgi:hypothetical protein
MPIPKPKPKEPKAEFINRCMSDEVMNKEYKDKSKRYAICVTQWENKQ